MNAIGKWFRHNATALILSVVVITLFAFARPTKATAAAPLFQPISAETRHSWCKRIGDLSPCCHGFNKAAEADGEKRRVAKRERLGAFAGIDVYGHETHDYCEMVHNTKSECPDYGKKPISADVLAEQCRSDLEACESSGHESPNCPLYDGK